MVDGNASMYLGIPRMAEMVIGEKVTLEEMGGAKMHCSVSGCGDVLVKTRAGGDRARRRRYLGCFPAQLLASSRRRVEATAPKARARRIEEIIPADQNKPSTCTLLINELDRRGLAGSR